MSKYELPFHIQEEIMKRLPVKSLIQFRSVSKKWKSLIDSSQFIAAHSLHCHTQPQHQLVWYGDSKEELHYVCIVDEETLGQQRPVLTFPLANKQIVCPSIVGISHGLVCLYCSDTKLTMLWNPSIRKSLVVDVPSQHYVGFGVCPITTEPKIVAIKQSWDESNIETSYQCEVMVYTPSSGNWRSLLSNLPTKPIQSDWCVVAAAGFIYWRVELPAHNMFMSFDVTDESFDELPAHNMFMSFDVTNESFEVIDLPDSLARDDPTDLYISKIKESLVILKSDRHTYTVWMMEDGIQRSFTKLFTIQAPEDLVKGFMKSGVPILQVTNDRQFKLVVYEPNSEHNNVFEISGNIILFAVYSYMETLLLLGPSKL